MTSVNLRRCALRFSAMTGGQQDLQKILEALSVDAVGIALATHNPTVLHHEQLHPKPLREWVAGLVSKHSREVRAVNQLGVVQAEQWLGPCEDLLDARTDARVLQVGGVDGTGGCPGQKPLGLSGG